MDGSKKAFNCLFRDEIQPDQFLLVKTVALIIFADSDNDSSPK